MLFPAQMGATARAEQSRSSTAAAGKESKNIILAISRLSVEGSARGSGLQASAAAAAAVDAKSLSSPPDVASDCAFVLLPSPSPSLPPSFPQVNFLFSLSLSLSPSFSRCTTRFLASCLALPPPSLSPSASATRLLHTSPLPSLSLHINIILVHLAKSLFTEKAWLHTCSRPVLPAPLTQPVCR